ncbi:MAG: GNAT family N-acetyltransferase [Clostridia bacterium]|nr:GNAT family N-acetyltransferase [Clostridia bacterium]MBQ7475243.1 GNAT family N-acetyltransferase [Clostridia bacterium]
MEFFDTSRLFSDEITLSLEKTKEADPARKRVPAYLFAILDRGGDRVGSCDLKIGYSDPLYYSGHIGYEIDEEHRGNHYAAKACRLLFGLAKKHGMKYLYITCAPENLPSRKTCEYLGGELVEIAELPEDHELRVERGHTRECIFRFDLERPGGAEK